ncbi:hypothetical protein L6164_037316 [Bauhinia variegata]|uniref:Uncharacterized protein n=1 Tax=Bauhinia variegata TaxID=167791 RepID=A0ACB9KK00_BAUVA|nr:hypothetical protein L6164_037316 [Bauhinia variegata]
MYPADSKVYTDYLVECWAAQGFLGDANDTCYQDVRDKGHEIVDDLVNVSLLEKGERKIYVRMQDCIKQLALHISSKSPDCHTYVLTSENSIQPNNSKAMKNSRWVLMVNSKLTDLPNGLGNVMLSTLLLQKNAELAVIQQTIFENMTNLVLLDLYGTRIEELPSSLSTLIALKGLCLNDCMLLTLLPSKIASLQCLQVLDIRGSGVPFIPIPIKSLANLKCLRISYVTRADQYGDHVILEFHKLEELIINVVSYQQWCKDAEHVMQQVASLKNLSTLRCSFPFASMLEEFLLISKSWQEIEGFLMFKEVTERERNVLPKLEKLILNNLPIFKSIHTKETLAWPSLELLEISDCLAMKSLPFGMDNAANLRSIKGQKEW